MESTVVVIESTGQLVSMSTRKMNDLRVTSLSIYPTLEEMQKSLSSQAVRRTGMDS